MDPDVVAQLEEQLRELTDMLSRQTSAMNAQMDAMNKVAGSAKSASDSMRNNSQTNTTTTTKYAEAQEKATAQTGKSEIASKALAAGFGTLSASVSSAIGVFGSLGSSLLSAEQGMAKYGKVADAAADGATNLAKSIPIVGDALGGLVGVVGKVAAQVLTDGLKLVDTFVDMRDGLVQTAGALPVTGQELIKLANNAGYYGERMQILGKITQGLGTNLAGLGMTAGQGATKFMELSAVTDDTRRQFGRMGVSQERLTEMQSLYIKSQIVSGNANELQAKTAGQLRKESLAYVENMTKLSSLTGKQAEQIQADQDVAMSEYEELAKQRQENAQIAQLKSEGRGEEAAAIKKEQQNRAEYLKEAATMYSPAEAAKLGRMARTGVYDQFTGSMAVLGISASELKENLKNAASGAEVFTNSYDEINKKTGDMALRVGDAVQFMGEEGGTGLGLARGFLEANRKFGDKSLADAKDQAAKDLEKRKTEGDDLADAVENIRSQERQFQAAYQEFLLDKVMKFSEILKDFDLFGLVTKNFSSIMTGLGVGLVAVTAASAALSVAATVAAARLAGVGGGGIDAGGPGAKGKGGFLGRFGGRIAGGIGGLLGGLALDYGADKAEEAGYNKTSGALGVGSAALTGAGLGAMFGPMGALVGGAAGGLYGLYSNSDKLFGNGQTPASKAAAANMARTGVLSPATYGAATEYTGLGADKESMEEMQNSLASRNRETAESFEEQQTASTKLLGTTGTLDSTLAATNKALKIFRELIVTINSALGGVDEEGNPTGSPNAAAVGPGGAAYTGNAGQVADINSVMAMNYQKESGGGKALRVRGLGGAGSIGGAYGLSQAARNSAFSSMSSDERQQFTAQTGFSRAPTLDELVNKEGTAFTSDKARLADELLSKKFTGNTITRLSERLGRAPTMADIRGAHWLGEAGYIGLLEAAKQNPNMSMEAFYASHPDWTKPDMKQFPGTVGEMISKIAEQAGGGVGAASSSGGGFLGAINRSTQGLQDFNQNLGGAGMPSAAQSGNIIALGRMLQSKYGLRVDENIFFDGKHPAPGSHSLKGGHYDGTAIDVNAPGSVVEANDPKYGPLFDEIARAGAAAGYHTLWKSPDGKHNNHIHFQYSGSMGKNSRIGAERGGILRGPDSGYPVELHGTEMIVPLDNRFTRSMTGVNNPVVNKNSKIQQSLVQIVNNETNKAIKAINETNAPMQNMSTEISNSMRKVMEAHNSTMYELTYKLGEMIDAMNTSNDVTKKILKKASA
jgi:hypothetical protein